MLWCKRKRNARVSLSNQPLRLCFSWNRLDLRVNANTNVMRLCVCLHNAKGPYYIVTWPMVGDARPVGGARPLCWPSVLVFFFFFIFFFFSTPWTHTVRNILAESGAEEWCTCHLRCHCQAPLSPDNWCGSKLFHGGGISPLWHPSIKWHSLSIVGLFSDQTNVMRFHHCTVITQYNAHLLD